MREQHRVRQGQNGRSALPAHGLERAVELRGTSHLQDLKLHPKRPMAVAQTLQGERMPWVVRIRQHGDPRGSGNHLPQELELLDAQIDAQRGHAGDVPPRASKTGNETQLNRIRTVHHDDRNRGRRPLGGKDGAGIRRDNRVGFEPSQLGCELVGPLGLPLGLSKIKDQVPTFDVSKVA